MQQCEVMYIRRVPEAVKNEFKSMCARRGLSMTDVLIEMMSEASRNPGHITKGMVANIEKARNQRKGE